MKLHHFYLVLSVLILVALGCSVLTPKDGNEPVNAANTPAVQPVEEEQGEPFITGPNLANIKLLTDTQGAGEKPLLKWESVLKAGYYQLVVFDEEGNPFWAWEGSETQIYLGGTDEEPPADSSGPFIASGYSWAVVAYNAENQVIASSTVRSISP